MDFSNLLVYECNQSAWQSVCVLLAFFRLISAMILSRMFSWLYCLSSQFPNTACLFVISVRVGDDILDFKWLVECLSYSRRVDHAYDASAHAVDVVQFL